MSTNTKPKAGGRGAATKDAPAPKIPPPGVVNKPGVHGPQQHTPGPGTPIARLRAVLEVSGEVSDDAVIREAADRLQDLLSQVPKEPALAGG